MSVEKYLTYRGDVRAIAATGGTVAFVTVHPEGQATGVYRLDADTLALEVDPLPRGGLALLAVDDSLWVGGDDGRIYRGSPRGGPLKALGDPLEAPIVALAAAADGRLAVLSGSKVEILARKDGKALQSLALPEPGTALAADPTGRWLAAGTARGTVLVFDAEDKPEFFLSGSEKLHEGAVSALLFEPDELRFLSAGADQKLLSTHARGKLEAEDKGRGANHTDVVTALAWGPGDRLYSGSRDGTVKNWPRAGAVRPATLKDGVGKVVGLALVHVHDRPRLALACDDNTVRIFTLDAAGKIGEASHRAYDAYAWARNELSQSESKRREGAILRLAEFDDAPSVELISAQVGQDADHEVCLLAVRKLGASRHPRAAKLLENWLGHANEAVRLAALAGLRAHLGEDDLRPLELALKAEKPDVGREAVRALEVLARRDDRAFARLLGALGVKTPEVRQAALSALEGVYDAGSPEASLVALGTKHADVRRLALVRLYQRGLLADPTVQTALRRRAEDDDPEVRRTAFLLSLLTRERLVEALRGRDPELRRQLAELEGAAPAAPEGEPAKARAKSKEKEKDRKKAEDPAAALDDADLAPLLQATASRALDTSLRGARGLALIGDPRAFSLLLQLSREENAKARAEVCRALAALDDPRGIERLRSLLHDKEAEVRDAAFSALDRLHQADPLLAAEAGLGGSFEDVHRRGLQVLIAEIRKAAAPRREPALALLARALNDGFPWVRGEAFKSALNLQLAGGGAGTLRFARRSLHADVRLDVLTEVMAQVGEPWGLDVLLEFFDDPEPMLRRDAFDFANKKTKGLEFLEAGLGSRHADIRKLTVEALVKKHTAAAQALLVRALDDEDRDVRLAALESLVVADAEAALTGALGNPHADVRLRAARALGRHGNRAALAPLLALASAPEPAEAERKADWTKRVVEALAGLAELGDPEALTAIIPLLDSPAPGIRQHAAQALVWTARPASLDALRQALPHADPQVKYRAALGLAYAGEASVAPLVFSKEAGKVLDSGERLAAALGLGPAGEDQLVLFLDDDDGGVRGRALLLLMLLELESPRESVARCLACLSSRMPRVRLAAARALETLADPSAFLDFVASLINDREDSPAWTIPAATVATLARLLANGPPLVKARTALLLGRLSAKEQAAWDLAWSVHSARFAGEIAALDARSKGTAGGGPAYEGEPLGELAFGAYVGLVREQGTPAGKDAKRAGTDPMVVRVRQTALARVLALARREPRFARGAVPVLIQALGDPNQPVRLQAFEHLQALQVDAATLGAEALGAGYTDLGVKGLEVLTAGAAAGEGAAILERVMLSRNDELAIEAGRLLIAGRGAVAVATAALAAAHEPLRQRAVAWLAAEYDADPAARAALQGALESRYQPVREAAALELAGKKDPAAFAALVKLLGAAHLPVPQRRLIQALVTLGDPRAADALLDRLEDDPSGSALGADLLKAVGDFRRIENADRLLALLAKDRKWRESAFKALLTISGFDQFIHDPGDEEPDRRREEAQHPRDSALLARLMESCFALGEAGLLSRLVAEARWARGKEVDPVLANLLTHPDDELRRSMVQAYGWRAGKRGAAADPLLRILSHRDPDTQFLAAEGLARAGRAEGLTVLLASLDFASDLGLRQRAVVALGKLADERALDTLLRLAGEDGHALQDVAAEAIGHLGRSAKAEEIFKLLERFARGDGDTAENALKGLRWFDSPAGWEVVRGAAVGDNDESPQAVALEMLGYDDEPATRDLLLGVVRDEETDWLVTSALASIRRLMGADSLEPDYALLSNPRNSHLEETGDALRRVSQRGEPARIFAIVPRADAEVREALASCLLGRASLPLAEARAALGSEEDRAVTLAARILGRAGPESSGAGAGAAIEAALARWRTAWDEERLRFPARVDGDDEDEDEDEDSEGRLGKRLTPCLKGLVWAAGRLGVARGMLLELASARPADRAFRPIRMEAVAALSTSAGEPDAAVAAVLAAAARGDDPELRAFAATALGRHKVELDEPLARSLLSDRVSFQRVAHGAAAALLDTARAAASQVNAQGVVLPFLVAQGDIEAIGAVAADRSLPDATRLGAVEALAAAGREDAEDRLRALGAAADVDEDLRKAAWRGLRRSKRARSQAARDRSPGGAWK